jgi:hypothetical protein
MPCYRRCWSRCVQAMHVPVLYSDIVLGSALLSLAICALSVVCLCAQMSPEERVELCTRLKGINFWGCISHTSIEAACVPVAGVGVGVGVGAGKDVHTHTHLAAIQVPCVREGAIKTLFSLEG